MREKIDSLAKHAKDKEMNIDLETRKLAKEKELVLLRLNDAKRKEEIASLEKERLEDAKRNLNLRYASIPRRSDLYPWPYFREFYGGQLHTSPLVVHHSYNMTDPHHCHDNCHSHHHHLHEELSPVRCKSCYKEKTTYILPPISNHGSTFKI